MILCIIVAVLIGLCAGNVNDLFKEQFGSSAHPVGSIIQLTYNAARGNKALASAPLAMMLPIIIMCCINTTAAASRMMFSFIRDDRNPHMQKLMLSVSDSSTSDFTQFVLISHRISMKYRCHGFQLS